MTLDPRPAGLEDLWFQLADFLRPRHFSQVAVSHLTMLRWLVRQGPITVSEAARRADVSASAITQAAKRLEGMGFLARRRSQQDQRLVFLEVTAAGRSQVDAVRARQAGRLQQLLSDLTSEEIAAMAEIMTKLIQAAQRQKESLTHD
ncbi:MAG: MarR family transcriptional regulator [Thermaerobacter sp.]|nr:MarR family transcriptional regulator [Thermaerobacter sp.]